MVYNSANLGTGATAAVTFSAFTTSTTTIKGNFTINATGNQAAAFIFKFRALTSGTLTVNGNLTLNGGYFEVASQHNGVRTKELVHRLIGMMFVHGYAEGLTINHINGIKINCPTPRIIRMTDICTISKQFYL